MAIFHLSAKIISRSSGRSAAAAMAYRAGCKLVDEARTGLTFDYRRKRDVIYTRVIAPKHAPAWMTDIQALANAIEARNTRKDSQLVREYEIAAPIELGHQAQIKLMERFVYSQFIKRGMVVHASLHDGGKGNPHFHLVTSLNEIDANHPTGFGKKAREWNEISVLNEVRMQWEIQCNRFLSNRGHKCSIDHRTLQAQGIDRKPIQRMSRMDYAGKKHRAAQATNNNNKENDMNNTSNAVPKLIDQSPPFIQAAKVRLNNLHIARKAEKPTDGVPPYKAEKFYCFWLSELLGVPIVDIKYTPFDFGIGYHIKLPTGSVMDYGDSLRCENSTPEEISALVNLAQAKGWTAIKLSGNESFKQQAFVFAVAQGFQAANITGYEFTPADIAMAQQMKAAIALAQQAVQDNVVTSQTTTQGAAQLKLNPPGAIKP